MQLPLPPHIDEEAVLKEVSLEKDVDGFHPVNIGKLCMKGRSPLFVPCTPEVSRLCSYPPDSCHTYTPHAGADSVGLKRKNEHCVAGLGIATPFRGP